MDKIIQFLPRFVEKVERATIFWRTKGTMTGEDWRELEALVKEAKNIKRRSICEQCGGLLRKHTKPPATAAKDGHLYFDYYKCQKCNVSFACVKEQS